jgi:tRNA(adenine34) deaminase
MRSEHNASLCAAKIAKVVALFDYFARKMIALDDHQRFMRAALAEAQTAADEGEVPVGAVVVASGRIIARAHNLVERLIDVTAHAEIQALTAASNYLGSKYLNKCTLYVTLEPCPMCAGALFWSQIGMVVYGASDEKRGYCEHGGSLHPKTEVIKGILAEECGQIMTDFFTQKRK